MAVAITKEGGSVKVDDGIKIEYYPIEDFKIKTQGTSLVIFHQNKQVGNFQFADITTPNGADVEEIADKIAAITSTNPTDIVEILKGNVRGQSFQNILGNNDNLSGTARKTIWDEDSAYVFPSAAATLTAESSDNVADTDSAGTGARKVTITGLLADFTEDTEVINLNGTTPVAGVKEFIRVNKAQITDAGSGGNNAGKITVKQGGNTLCVIRPTENRSDGAIFTIPANKSGVLYAPSFASSAGTEVDAFVTFRTSPTGLFLIRKILSIFENSLTSDLQPVLALPEKSDILLEAAKLSGAAPKVSGIVQILLTDN